MKSFDTHKPVIAAVAARWLSNVAALAKAFHYGHAAQHDERNGFPYTAAMEWRNAAELLCPKTRSAEYCWRQWERIMHLPRRLAQPIRDSAMVAVSVKSASATQWHACDQISFATAA